ncbi:GTP cyclohydrolase I [Candidatus Anaplasma sp. TIGMIC]|uniref:GTP cyclohydrolase I n=1 Tax=Candidatus Anaplasma sp. TIGMIC TaxID=3020713 RepID=UPI00232BFFA9|nr:GTP cyclohydrolase I [Candidatus Anaplasma sp. TIGMIC]MDB1135639.1 GTP cyclohydrolase I [Candidatus Anaplasma sp. TIGMIC]
MGSEGSDRPTLEEAEEAVRVIIRWIGDFPGREGLRDTPKKVLDAYRRSFRGYEFGEDDRRSIKQELLANDSCTEGMVVVRDMSFTSSCEHHMSPFRGRANVAYIPGKKVIGIGDIVRIVDGFASRLQLQERLTKQIALCMVDILEPRGVAVLLEAKHRCVECYANITGCSSLRVQTSKMLGEFENSSYLRDEFFNRLKV